MDLTSQFSILKTQDQKLQGNREKRGTRNIPASIEHKEEMKKNKRWHPAVRIRCSGWLGMQSQCLEVTASHGAGGDISVWCSLTFGAESVLCTLLLNRFYEEVGKWAQLRSFMSAADTVGPEATVRYFRDTLYIRDPSPRHWTIKSLTLTKQKQTKNPKKN